MRKPQTVEIHQHQWSEEEWDAKKGQYKKTCVGCGMDVFIDAF